MKLEEAKQILNDEGYLLTDAWNGDITDLFLRINKEDEKEIKNTRDKLEPLKKELEKVYKELLEKPVKEYFEKGPFKLYIFTFGEDYITVWLTANKDNYNFSADLKLDLPYFDLNFSYWAGANLKITNISTHKEKRIPISFDKKFTKRTPIVIQETYKELLDVISGTDKLKDILWQNEKFKEIYGAILEIRRNGRIANRAYTDFD